MSCLKSIRYIMIYRTGRIIDINFIRRVLMKRFGCYANIDIEAGIAAVQEALV